MGAEKSAPMFFFELMKKITIFLLLILVSAKSFASLAIDPARLEMTVGKDMSYKGSYSITNNYEDDVEVFITAQNWYSYKGNTDLDVSQWFNIMPDKMTIKKGQTRLAVYNIHTNSSMQGSVAGQVTFAVKPPGNQGINVKMSFPVYLTIGNTQKVEFSLEKVSFVNFQGNTEVVLTIQNDGNVHVRPLGTMNIYDSKNKLKYTDYLLEGFPVYAGTYRNEFAIKIPKEIYDEPGKYTAEFILRDGTYNTYRVTKKFEFRVKKDGTIAQ